MNEPLTVDDLRSQLADVPGDTWVLVSSGPAIRVFKELGASEPFIVIEGTEVKDD